MNSKINTRVRQNISAIFFFTKRIKKNKKYMFKNIKKRNRIYIYRYIFIYLKNILENIKIKICIKKAIKL